MDSFLIQPNDMKGLIQGYYKWLMDNTSWRQINEVMEITTPFLNRHNDFIQIYIQQLDNGCIRFTDLGETIADLEMSGCDIQKGRRKKLLTQTINGFGVRLDGDDLFVDTTKENFFLAKHSLLQAIMSVDDIFYSAKPANPEAFFFEDVEAWLDSLEIRYTPRVTLVGRSQFQNYFDFAIPRSKNSKERLIKLVNRPTSDAARLALFSWSDIQEEREASFYVIYRKPENKDDANFKTAFNSYDATPIPWDSREKFASSLAA